jgi:hypothetical protein
VNGSLLADDDLIPFDEFVAKLKTSPRTGRRLIASGKIGVVRIGAAVRIPAAELARFLSSNYTPPREERKPSPQSIVDVLDRIAPRKRGVRK